MPSIYEKSLSKFYSSYNNLAKVSDDLSLEDARFVKFTELLQIGNIIDNPTVCRYSGGPANQPWGLLGYSYTEEINIVPQKSEAIEDEDGENPTISNEFESFYRYTFINGFFDGENVIRNAKKSELERAVKQVTRFVENTVEKQDRFVVKDEHEIQDLQRNFIDNIRKQKIDRIDFIIITDTVIPQDELLRTTDINGYEGSCSISYWDLQRWSDLMQSKSKRVPVDFSFEDMGYLPANASSLVVSSNNGTSCYLAIIPGAMVADLYDNFHTRLLESNVRVFLSLKRKTNQQMVETIDQKPEMFLSYNNGLSATASSVVVDNNGAILAIQDFQIVNGGQTTATLYHAKNRLKKDLKQVNVQLKLTVIREEAIREEAVPKISRYANTQTAIRKSDFEANLPYLIDIVKVSGKTYITTESGNNRYYYFERMAGQYNEDKNKQGNGVRLREWERRFPVEGKFDKIDLGRWSNIIAGFPHMAASSAENSFSFFVNRIHKLNLQMTANIFKDLVGFGILFRRARKVCGSKKGRQFPSIIGDSSVAMATTIYSMAYLHHFTNGRFDYHLLFEQRLNEQELDNFLIQMIKEVWKLLEMYGGTSVQEQTKKADAWRFVKENLELGDTYLNSLAPFLLTEKELLERNQGEINETDKYFSLLEKYFGNHASRFTYLYDLAHIDLSYIRSKTLVRNIKKQLEKQDSKITLSRLEQLDEFENQISRNKLDYSSTKASESININVDFAKLYRLIFSDTDTCLKKLENQILNGGEDEFDRLADAFTEIKEAVEEYHSWECMSIQEFIQLQANLDLLNKPLHFSAMKVQDTNSPRQRN